MRVIAADGTYNTYKLFVGFKPVGCSSDCDNDTGTCDFLTGKCDCKPDYAGETCKA